MISLGSIVLRISNRFVLHEHIAIPKTDKTFLIKGIFIFFSAANKMTASIKRVTLQRSMSHTADTKENNINYSALIVLKGLMGQTKGSHDLSLWFSA